MLKSLVDQNLVFCHDLGLDNESTPKIIFGTQKHYLYYTQVTGTFFFLHKAIFCLLNLPLFSQIIECLKNNAPPSFPFLPIFHCNTELKEIKATAILMIKEFPTNLCSKSSNAFNVEAMIFTQKAFQILYVQNLHVISTLMSTSCLNKQCTNQLLQCLRLRFISKSYCSN